MSAAISTRAAYINAILDDYIGRKDKETYLSFL